MAMVTLTQSHWVTQSQTEAIESVRPLIEGAFSDGVTLQVAENRVRMVHKYWRVPLIPSHWPDHTSPLYEDIAIIEEKLRENGIDDIILSLTTI